MNFWCTCQLTRENPGLLYMGSDFAQVYILHNFFWMFLYHKLLVYDQILIKLENVFLVNYEIKNRKTYQSEPIVSKN